MYGLADLTDPAAHYRAVTADEVRAVAAHILGPALTHAEGVVRGAGGGK